MVTVAIASENDTYDAEIYRVLLELVLGRTIVRHPTQRTFSGWKSVRDLSDPYLKDAHRQGVRHALFAIDNDGGAKRAPEHENTHNQVAESQNEDGCRACWLSEVLPAWWAGAGGKRCVVVPVQAVETWLLCIRGKPTFTSPTPEQTYHRRVLKERFLGKPRPPDAACIAIAIAELRKPGALDILRERRSFLHFEQQLSGWP